MYKISSSYNWYNTGTDRLLIKTYHICGIPFTFDDISDESQYHPEYMLYANQNVTYTPEDMYRSSFYLIDEQCHPMLFELELENPELMPSD